MTISTAVLGDFWPGIQLYYPPVKYAPSLGIYEDLEAAAQRFKKHAHLTNAHTLLFDLEDGCRQKAMSRDLLRQELPALTRSDVTVAVRINPFRTEEYELDLKMIRDLANHIDVVMLAKAGEAYGRIEGPKGEIGFYLISDGSPNPLRYRVRAPSFVNLTILEDMCLGHTVADAVIILGSVDIVLGEVDR